MDQTNGAIVLIGINTKMAKPIFKNLKLYYRTKMVPELNKQPREEKPGQSIKYLMDHGP